MEQLVRTEALFGKENVESLRKRSVIVFGIGGVGGYVCEALARSGVGRIALVDGDSVALSNLNRQIIALHSTVGRSKVEVMRKRIADIDREIRVECFDMFYTQENADKIDLSSYDYVIDAIDMVKSKVELCVRCDKLGIPMISSMGTGNKVDPTAFKIADIYKTSVCPLARAMRTELKKKGIKKLKVVYSEEPPVVNPTDEEGNRVIASSAFTPSVAGMIIASEVIKYFIKERKG